MSAFGILLGDLGMALVCAVSLAIIIMFLALIVHWMDK